MDIYSIYKITNTINNKVYIGFTKNPNIRLNNHKTYSTRKKNKFYNAICKYGWDCFVFEIIYQSLDGEHCLNNMESHFINEYNSYFDGYNSTLGGEGTLDVIVSQQTKIKQSKSRDGRFLAKDCNGKIYTIKNDDPRFLSGELVGINKGVSQDEKTLMKLSESRKGNKYRLGIKHSDEIKKIISKRTSEALKGKPKNKVSCPHCHKIGGQGNMKRYHFNNCKNKN